MRTLLVLTIALISPLNSLACSCDWGGNFMRSSSSTDLIFKGKVIERTFYLPSGESFHDESQALSVMIEKNLNTDNEIAESITIEIDQVIKGLEERRTIRILSTDGADCRESTKYFKVGATYIFSASSLRRSTHKTNEGTSDYSLSACSESSLEFNSQTNQVKGRIKSTSHEKKIIYLSYDKFLKLLERS